MKTIIILLFLFPATVITVHAQSLERQVVGAAGAYQAASWGTLSSTAGEAVINTFTGAANVLTQGFQQPMPGDINVMVYNVAVNNISVQAYPSPASGIINVAISNPGAGKHYTAALYNLPGQRLDLPYTCTGNSNEMLTQIDIHQLAAATYMILVTDENNVQVKAFKISKID